VPFYVCTPLTSVDLGIETGADIPIEERPGHEMTAISGVKIAPDGNYVFADIKFFS